MDIKKDKQGNKLTVCVSGRLDTVTAPELDKVLSDELGGVFDLVIDLQGLEYISSAGLRVLLTAQKTMNRSGSMTVKNAGESVMEVFEITGFSDILNIE